MGRSLTSRFDRTPDAMLGDTSGDTDQRGELSNTQPLFKELSEGNHTVLILAMSNCATGVRQPCNVNTVSPAAGGVSGCTCQRAWNEVISKSYNTMKGDPNAPLCNVPREGCDSPTVPLKCAHYHYPAQPSATPYCTFQYPCTDDSQYVSDSLDWVMARYAATPIFLAGFSNGAQLSMSIACDTRIIDKVSAVISHHGTPSGDYCCWDNPHRPKAKATTGHKLQGFLHVAGQQGVDPTLPTFCSTQAAGYCDIAGYNYSSAQGNMECWNKTLGE